MSLATSSLRSSGSSDRTKPRSTVEKIVWMSSVISASDPATRRCLKAPTRGLHFATYG